MPSSTPRQTSLDAYHAIVDSGVLGTARTEAYKLVYNHGPLAQFEVEQYEQGNKHYGGTLSKRFSELEEIGAIAVVGKKTNPISNQQCNVYDVTSKIITSPYKAKLSSKQKAKALRDWFDRMEDRYQGKKIDVTALVAKTKQKMDELGL